LIACVRFIRMTRGSKHRYDLSSRTPN
jgi:hypothetical protein